jgi:hypothetical protein
MTATKRAGLYMAMAHIGGIASILLALGNMLAWPDFVRGFAIGMLLVSLVLLLRRKLRDEFIERLWSAGTSLAFFAVVAWFVLTPFVEGYVRRTGAVDAWPRVEIGLIAIIAFFIGFHVRWLRARTAS